MKVNADLTIESISITGLDSEMFPMTILKGYIKIPTEAAGTLKTSFTISYEASQPEFDLLQAMWKKRSLYVLGVSDERDP